MLEQERKIELLETQVDRQSSIAGSLPSSGNSGVALASGMAGVLIVLLVVAGGHAWRQSRA